MIYYCVYTKVSVFLFLFRLSAFRGSDDDGAERKRKEKDSEFSEKSDFGSIIYILESCRETDSL